MQVALVITQSAFDGVTHTIFAMTLAKVSLSAPPLLIGKSKN